MDRETQEWLDGVYRWLDERPGWNRERLADEAGMNSSCFNNWARGKSSPSKTSRIRIDRIIDKKQKPVRDEELRDFLLRYPGMDAEKVDAALSCIRAFAGVGRRLVVGAEGAERRGEAV